MAIVSHPLEFEKPVLEIEEELARLRDEIAGGNESRRGEFAKLESRLNKTRNEVFARLTPYQRVQLSRHFDRPQTLDYIGFIATDFVEFHGDRLFRDDPAIVGGTARIGDVRVMIIGHQRGRTTTERLERNFGMSQPEGYRKALRLFRMAERFKLPVITLIDTQGAFPGLEAEERGQAEAIAKNLAELARLKVPVIAVVIGEGGSGGALALGVADRILMMENACYSVITPEGCASILWHGEGNVLEQAAVAAANMQVTAQSNKANGIVDEIIPEPMGGAHRNPKEAAESLAPALLRHLAHLQKMSPDKLIDERYKKFRAMGPVAG